jgi:LemA protein
MLLFWSFIFYSGDSMQAFFSFIGTIFQIAIFVAVLIAVVAFFGYNKLRALAEGVKESFSNIGVIMKKQVSLINQLIEAVTGYAESEKLVILKVSSDLSAENVSAVHQQSGMVLSAVSGIAQRYPELKSNQQYNRLMENIREIEDQLEVQRERYNGTVKAYNIQRTSIPHVFYSKLLGFNQAPYLDFTSADASDIGALKTLTSDDGERLTQLLGAAGNKMADLGRDLGSISHKAVNQSKVLLENTQEKLKQKMLVEFHYLDADKNPAGPVSKEELDQLYLAGAVRDDTMVMQEGEKRWLPYREVAQEFRA